MHTRFFPLNKIQDIMDRQLLILSEYKTSLSEDVPVLYFMYISDKAESVRNERRKAAENGQIYHG